VREARGSGGWAVAAFGGALVWLLVHFSVYLRAEWWRAPFEGEWDVLLPALAVAAGDAPRVAVGTIHGFEIGSYAVAWLAGLLVRGGLDATVASRYLAAAVGGAGAALISGATWHFLAGKGRLLRTAGTGASIAFAALLWPHWQFQNVGVTGTSLEASVLVAALFVGLTGTPTATATRALGATLTTALLFSSLALVALPLVVLIAVLRRDLEGSKLAQGAAVPVLFAALLPGGPSALINVGWAWLGAPLQALATSPGALDARDPLRAITILAPPDLYTGAPATLGVSAGSGLIIGTLLLLARSRPSSPSVGSPAPASTG